MINVVVVAFLLALAAILVTVLGIFHMVTRMILSAERASTEKLMTIFTHLEDNATVGGQPASLVKYQADMELERSKFMNNMSLQARKDFVNKGVAKEQTLSNVKTQMAQATTEKERRALLDKFRKQVHT